MSWFGKLTLGSLGLIFGGPLGAVAGAALGHILIDKSSDLVNQTIRPGPETPIQAGREDPGHLFHQFIFDHGQAFKDRWRGDQ